MAAASHCDSQAAAALRIVLPQVASLFQHPEARRMACVCKEWQRLVALAPLVTTVTDKQSTYVEGFINTELSEWDWTDKDTEAVIAFNCGSLFETSVEGSELNAKVLSYQFQEDEDACEFALKLVIRPELLSEIVDATTDCSTLEEGITLNLPRTKNGSRYNKEDRIVCSRSGYEDSLEAMIEKFTETEVVLTLDLTYYTTEMQDLQWEDIIILEGNPGQDAFIESKQNGPVEEGVVWYDSALSESQIDNLDQAINQFAITSPKDYHPGSNGMVRDLVHPALYAYRHGETKVLPGVDASRLFRPKFKSMNPNVEGENPGEFDRFLRPYEPSDFQWLPSNVSISHDNTVTFTSEINGLRPQEDYKDLYDSLASLLASFMPKLEAVFHYVQTVQFPASDDSYEELEIDTHNMKRRKLSNLQVIPKIVDYELAPGETYEGVWHIEGMAHEHIVATCLYILERDSCIEGGEIQFKRAWTTNEADSFMEEVGQCSDDLTKDRIENGLMPLGSVGTPQGRMVVFPNTHVHKVQAMTNTGSTPCRRRIVVFFVVDPDVKVISTAEVPDQSKSITLETAKEWRLNLMNERKYYKQDWNLREISLCEH
mmetsp:Transcript_5051/g.9020  ORF Transcript_5051/g.9020 Transcript_5051/m.9020 type:complete len:599 (-) Transcript_5051:191-1987(-)